MTGMHVGHVVADSPEVFIDLLNKYLDDLQKEWVVRNIHYSTTATVRGSKDYLVSDVVYSALVEYSLR